MAKTKPTAAPVMTGNGLPDPRLNLPDLDSMFSSGGMPGEAEMLAGSMPPAEGEMTGAPPMPNFNPPGAMPPELDNGSPTSEIVKKMGPKEANPETKAVNIITTTISKLNQLAEILSVSDEANSRAVRQMIRILGEILKSAQHDQIPDKPIL